MESDGGDHTRSPTESPRPTGGHSVTSTGPASAPTFDKEVEEIIRFINGVDDVMTSSSTSGGVSTATKHKTKQKCRKVCTTALMMYTDL